VTVIASDNFNRANVNPIGGNWTTAPSFAALQILTSAAQNTSDTGTDNGAYWNANSFPNDQYSQCNVTDTSLPEGANGECGPGPMCRVATSAPRNLYRVVFGPGNTTNLFFEKYAADSYSPIAGFSVTINNGDLLKLQVQGTTLTAFVNGTQVATTTDSSVTTGPAGLAFSSCPAGSTVTFDNWEAGDLAQDAPERRGMPFGLRGQQQQQQVLAI
jgi:hypothetical protein